MHESSETIDPRTALIDERVACHVLHHFGCGGYRPGSFTELLIQTIAAGDPTSRARLAMGFPEYVDAVDLAQGDLDGIARLQALAGIAPREAQG